MVRPPRRFNAPADARRAPSPPVGVAGGAAPAAAGPGVTYAVGDIHGRFDLLEDLLRRIRAADGSRGGRELRLVFLGDYVDRGPDSARVIDRVAALAEEGWCAVAALKGNHEELMLKFLDGAPIGPEWMKLGGAPTLKSYGVDLKSPVSTPAEWDSVRRAFADRVPDRHVAFLRGLQLWTESGDYLFVHAGVKPSVPMELQRTRDLLWIRGEFTRAPRPHEKVVVYGHTPTPEPNVERWKIGLDTGAYGTGVLTALRLEGVAQSIVQARVGRAVQTAA